jgi:mRNA interferase YafQ
MPKIYHSKRFEKSFKKLLKSGRFDDSKLDKVFLELEEGNKLEIKYKDHQLTGKMLQYRECHIENDLLLVYEISKSGNYIEIIDIGSHSDLFE